MRDFDDKILANLVGMPEHRRAGNAGSDDVIRAHGLAGRLLLWLSGRFQQLEHYLVLHRTEGVLTRYLRHVGDHLQVFEALLEHPRYLILTIMVTFVVIL